MIGSTGDGVEGSRPKEKEQGGEGGGNQLQDARRGEGKAAKSDGRGGEGSRVKGMMERLRAAGGRRGWRWCRVEDVTCCSTRGPWGLPRSEPCLMKKSRPGPALRLRLVPLSLTSSWTADDVLSTSSLSLEYTRRSEVISR